MDTIYCAPRDNRNSDLAASWLSERNATVVRPSVRDQTTTHLNQAELKGNIAFLGWDAVCSDTTAHIRVDGDVFLDTPSFGPGKLDVRAT